MKTFTMILFGAFATLVLAQAVKAEPKLKKVASSQISDVEVDGQKIGAIKVPVSGHSEEITLPSGHRVSIEMNDGKPVSVKALDSKGKPVTASVKAEARAAARVIIVIIRSGGTVIVIVIRQRAS
jgi:hypothetical protein